MDQSTIMTIEAPAIGRDIAASPASRSVQAPVDPVDPACFFRGLLEAVSEGVVAIGADDEVRYLNPAAARLLGIDGAEAVGRPVAAVLPSEPGRRTRRSAAIVRWIRRRSEAEIDLPVWSGPPVPVALRAVDAEVCGEIFLVVTLHEIRRRRAVEAQVRASEARLARLLDIADDAIVSTDGSHRIILFNKGAERTFGFRADEVIGQRLEILLPTSVRATHAARMDAFGSGTVAARMMGDRTEVTGRRKCGAEFPAEASISRFTQDDATIFTAVLRDVSERKAIERQLMAARAEAEEASRAKSDFLASMSHELRTPLNAIIGFADMMCTETMGPLGSRIYHEYAGDILSSGQHLLDMINDILDFMKAEAGQLLMQTGEVDVLEEVTNCARMVQPRAERSGVTLSTAIDPAARYFLGDAKRFRQILLNLLTNAIKFTPAGGSVAVAARLDAAGRLLLTVRDTGVGIAPEDRTAVMEAFRQASHALDRNTEGTGLGLPLTKRLIEMHGGTLSLDSEVGAGTTVTAHFPAECVIRREDHPPR